MRPEKIDNRKGCIKSFTCFDFICRSGKRFGSKNSLARFPQDSKSCAACLSAVVVVVVVVRGAPLVVPLRGIRGHPLLGLRNKTIPIRHIIDCVWRLELSM